MKIYKEIIKDILENGDLVDNRTGVKTFSLFGKSYRYKMSDGFPILTTRYQDFEKIVIELLWFLRGSGNCDYLDSHNVKLWKAWTDKDTNSIGPLYPVQWRNYESITRDENGEFKVEYIDQLQNAIDNIRNNPFSRRHVVSTWNPTYLPDESISPIDNVKLGKQALPPCFPEGTLISTPEGYRNIEDIREGDIVYSDTLTPRKVTKVYKSQYDGLMRRVTTSITNGLISTPNHEHKVNDNEYLEASKITKDNNLYYPYINNKVERKNYTIEYISVNSQRESYTLKNNDYYTLGFLLGNGWIDDFNQSLYLIIPTRNHKSIYPEITSSIVLHNRSQAIDSETTYSSSSELWYFLGKEFRLDTTDRVIPDWLFNSPDEAISQFLSGYSESNSYNQLDDMYHQYTTVSKKLAYGLQRLFLYVGNMYSITKESDNSKVIEGKYTIGNSILIPDIYKLTNEIFEDSTWDNGNLIIPVGSAKDLYTIDNIFVYNLEVEEENTYIADNIATHNCHTLYQFSVRKLSLLEALQYEDNLIPLCDICRDLVDEGVIELPFLTKPLRYDNTPDKVKECALIIRNYIRDNPDRDFSKYRIKQNALSLQLYQRSWDVGAAGGWNVSQYSLLLHMVAKITNLIPYEFIHSIGDIHIYEDQLPVLSEQITREEYPLPHLVITGEQKEIDDFNISDFSLINYNHHPRLKIPVAT